MVEPGLQERVARLEGRTEDFGDRFDALERRLDSLERRMDARFESVDQRLAGIDERLSSLEDRMSRHFRWLVGGQFTLLVAVVGALSTALFLS